MKNNLNNEEGGDLESLFKMIAEQAGPAFRPTQKVFLRCGEMAGMVIAVVCYANRYAYIVRWSDGTTAEMEDYELTDCKTWSE